MTKYTISESRLKELVVEEVKSVVTKRRLMNVVYKATQQLTSRLYNDDHWQGVNDVRDALGKLGIEAVIYPKHGGYRQNKDGDAFWKEYQVQLQYGGVVVNGILNCHAAGSVEYPFDRYDMTLQLW